MHKVVPISTTGNGNLPWGEFPRRNGVYYISDRAGYLKQEELYIKVRKREGRVYEDELVERLPLIDKNDPYYGEWELRLIAAMRLHKYLLEKKRALKILDIGCGNGWMANLMSQVYHSQVFAIDVNTVELEQGTRLFGENPLLKFAYLDILKAPFPERQLDVIILAATIQYFPDLPLLLKHLLGYLLPGGEIHIIDSPVYEPAAIEGARERTRHYYDALGFPGMAGYYNHHSNGSFRDFDHRLLYDPAAMINKVRRKILSSSDSPFPWIVIYNR